MDNMTWCHECRDYREIDEEFPDSIIAYGRETDVRVQRLVCTHEQVK